MIMHPMPSSAARMPAIRVCGGAPSANLAPQFVTVASALRIQTRGWPTCIDADGLGNGMPLYYDSTKRDAAGRLRSRTYVQQGGIAVLTVIADHPATL